MRVTIYDVAKKAGVGIGTVSRVLNDHPSVREETRAKILNAIEELGYTPHAMARGLAAHRTNSIGIVVPFFTHHFFIEILKGIQAAAYEFGLDIILYNVQSGEQKAKYFKRLSSEKKVDGVIIINLTVRDENIKAFSEANIPIILVDTYHKDATCLTVDNVKGARIAVEHLLLLGHERIAFLNGLLRYHSSRDRSKGYSEALNERNISTDQSLIVESEFSRAEGFKAMRQLWDTNNEKPSAVFAASDLQAIGAIEYLTSQGLRVPEDVSIVGFDNIELAELVNLTTIGQPMYEMGVDALKMLVERLSSTKKGGDPTPDALQKVYTPTLVVRKSTMPKM